MIHSNPSFTLKKNFIVNVLETDVDISQAVDLTENSHTPFSCFRAVWDTGAMCSVITSKVVEQCNLKPIGMIDMRGVNSEFRCATYLINVRLPNQVYFTFIKVVQGKIPSVDILIGMDLIARGDFAITNKNEKTVFSFRTPSLEHIDFTQRK